MVILRRDPPNRGVECKGYEKITTFDQISLYLGNDENRASYYGRRIENRTQAFEWYQFELMTFSDL